MRIAYYTDTYYPTMDGVVRSIDESRNELISRGHEVYIFAPGTKDMIRSNNSDNVYYYESIPFKPYPKYHLAINPFPSASIIERRNIELIHSHSMGSMGIAARKIAKKRNIPFVGTFHTLIQYATHYLFRNKILQDIARDIGWKYLKWYYDSCKITIVPSKTIYNLVKTYNFKNLKIVPNGLNLERFYNSKCVNKSENLNLLFVGRLVKEKNLDVAIKGLKYIKKDFPDIRFKIVGDGPARSYYEELSKKYHVDKYIEFLGFTPDNELPSIYRCSDVFIFPSKFETQGLSGIEAMASGLPIVGANYLAIKELVKDGKNGYLFNPDDPRDFSEKLKLTLNDLSKLGNSSKRLSRRYNIKNTSQRLLEIYEEIIKR